MSCLIKQEDIALWASVALNYCVHYGDGTIGQGLTLDIAKGLCICERMCYACIARQYPKASEQEGEKKIAYRPAFFDAGKNFSS